MYQKLDETLKTTSFLLMKIPGNQEIQQIAKDDLSDTDSKVFMQLYRKFTTKNNHFLLIIH